MIDSYKCKSHTIETLSIENGETKWNKVWNGEPNLTEKVSCLFEDLYLNGFELNEIEQYKQLFDTIYLNGFELNLLDSDKNNNLCLAVLSKTTELGYGLGYHLEEKLTFAPTMDSFINSIENLFQNFDANKETDKVWQSIKASGHATYRSILNDMKDLNHEINKLYLEISGVKNALENPSKKPKAIHELDC